MTDARTVPREQQYRRALRSIFFLEHNEREWQSLEEAQEFARTECERIDGGPSPKPAAEPAPDEYMCPNCVTPWKCNGPHIDRTLLRKDQEREDAK